jgi:Tfp pilus assembly protein PilV
MKDPRTNNRRPARAAAARQEGFTIIETVVSMLIMMIAGFGAISLFMFSMNYNTGATPYDSLSTVAAAMPASENVGSPNAPDNDQRTFNVTTTVADDANVPNSRQKVITVTVTPATAGPWTGGGVMLRCYRSSNIVN